MAAAGLTTEDDKPSLGPSSIVQLGAVLLGMFPDTGIEAIVAYVRSRPFGVTSGARQAYAEVVGQEPALNFLGPFAEIKHYGGIIGGMTIVLKDALGTQWTREQYALALSRVGNISLTMARKITDTFVVTEDERGIIDFARRLVTWMPSMPMHADAGVKMALDTALDYLVQALPSALVNNSGDTLYEWYRLGVQAKELTVRAQMTVREAAYEKKALFDWASVKDAAGSVIPLLVKTIGAFAGQGGAPLLTEGGDVESGDSEFHREYGDWMSEAGDLIAQAATHTGTEQGFLGGLRKWARKGKSMLGRMAKKVAPQLLNRAVEYAGNMIAPGAGSAASGFLQSSGITDDVIAQVPELGDAFVQGAIHHALSSESGDEMGSVTSPALKAMSWPEFVTELRRSRPLPGCIGIG